METDRLVLIIFLAFFAAHVLIERGLAVLNVRHVLAHRGQTPELLAGVLSEDYQKRSIDYTLARAYFSHLSAGVSAALTLLFLFSGLLPWLHEIAQRATADFNALTTGVVFIGLFSFLSGLLALPLELYETFRLEARFGFNQTTAGTFWLDKLKGLLLALALGVPFLYALLAFITYTGARWWLWAALFVIAFQLVLMVLYPLLIAPWFNKFTPLAEGELKQRLEELARRCAFAVRGIFVMDGSKRSAHSNAYFTGLGKARRIVLYDTLIKQMSVDELAAVLAHEIGHYKRKHILKMLALSSVLTLGGFYVLSLLLAWPPMYAAFGLGAPNVPMGLLVFSLTAGHLAFWAKPFFSWLSRTYEYQADAYAAGQAGAAPLETALVKLLEKNLSALLPHPLYSAYHYSHPALAERIGALRETAKNKLEPQMNADERG